MTTIKIPTAEQLDGRLRGLDRLIVARNWERAAIVSAFTRNDGPGRPTKLPTSGQFPVTVAEFAALGFKGLTKRDTVALYRLRWQEAVDAGLACSVNPGDEVDLPEMDWPPNPDPRLRTDGTPFEDSADRAEEIQRLAASPELGGKAKGAMRAATSSPETLQVVAQTATADQALALAEGLRRRAIDHSGSYTAGVVGADLPAPPLTAEQVRGAVKSSSELADAAREAFLERARERHADDRAEPKISTAEVKARAAERAEYHDKVDDFLAASQFAVGARVSARKLTDALTEMTEAGRSLSERDRDAIRDDIHEAQRYLATAAELLAAPMSVADSASEFLKNNS